MKALVLLLATLSLLPAAEPRRGPKQKLFNGKNLDGFYVYLRDRPVNSDPNRVIRVEKGEIHVSGVEYGYFCTKQEYENYFLRVDFRWGRETHPPRENKARDSGILFHTSGKDMIWPRSIEFQMIEGGTGDIIFVGGSTAEATASTGELWGKNRYKRLGKGDWKDVAGWRDPKGELEKPLRDWNKLELWAEGDRFRYFVNGKLANEGVRASDRRGRILFQSEGAELYFRNIVLRPLR